MLPTTMQAVRSILAADPSINPPERNRLLAVLRHGPEVKAAHPTAPALPRIMRRREVAQRLSVSLRTVDKLAKVGTLRKRRFPGRVRASGFLESDIVNLLTGEGAAE
jgi:predicted DNA-binding transcriptional regulator AlpA